MLEFLIPLLIGMHVIQRKKPSRLMTIIILTLLSLFTATTFANVQTFDNRFDYDAAIVGALGTTQPVSVSGSVTLSPTDQRFVSLYVVLFDPTATPAHVTSDTLDFTSPTTFTGFGFLGDSGPVTFTGSPSLSVFHDPPTGHNLQIIPEPASLVLFVAGIIILAWRPRNAARSTT